MTPHQVFYESSCLIDAGIPIPAKHLDLDNVSDCGTKQEAKLLLEKLRDRLRSAEEVNFKLSQESKLRLIALLSNQ